MYEELLIWLRGHAKRHGCDDRCPCYDAEDRGYTTCSEELAQKAADAIEELTATAESYKRSMEAWADEAARAYEMMPSWIPVTERLPKAYEDVMLLFPHNQAAGFCDRDGCWGVYSGDGFYTEVAENEPKPTHWARKLPEPPREDKYV